jgi:hypothetical protein
MVQRLTSSWTLRVAEGLYLDCFDDFPDSLLDVPACELWRFLRGPSLFRIPGRDAEPVFVSVLLHGNEDTGWQAIQALLRDCRGAIHHRPLTLFVGNIEAARARVRTLPQQEDFNRAWPGTERPDTPIAHLMRTVVEIVRSQKPFASIDIHNNSGHNPHYACVDNLAEPHLQLARLFSRTVVYFELPVGVQSAALAKICPAVTVECGRSGDPANAAHAVELIRAALTMQHLPDHAVPEGDIDLMQTFAVIKVPPDASFSYDGSDADFRLRGDLDRLNFSELEPGSLLGALGNGHHRRLTVQSADGDAADADYFDYTGGEIRLSRCAVPAMLTLDPAAVRLDCLGYLMHRIGRDGRRLPE